MRPAEFLNQGYPHLSVGLKFFEFKRIDDVAQVTGNQGFRLTGLVPNLVWCEVKA